MIRADVEALCALPRDSAGPGERRAAAYVARRLGEAGAGDVRVKPFRGAPTYAWAHLAHAGAGLLSARLGGWRGRALAAAGLVSFELELSGRAPWLRRLLPRGEGANVVARVAPRGARRRTLVVVVHHDAARTGLVWHPRVQRLGINRRGVAPFAAPDALAALAVASGRRSLRALGALGWALTAALLVDIGTRRTVPGASDNATGVAVLVDLAARLAAEPLDGVEAVLVSTGCEESGMDGMRAFLAGHALDPATTFVLGLDTLGAGEPVVLEAEGAMLRHRYAEADIALVEQAARRAGLEPPRRRRVGGWTDPLLALHAGIPAACVCSVGPDGHFTNYHLPTDTPDRVDWASVERCRALAEAVARAL